MPFHVEISRGINHARAFNLEPEDLRRTVLEPWIEERPVRLGDHEWDPRRCELRVLEGPALDPPELSFGQGWSNAERGAENVTRSVLADAAGARERRPAPTAIEVEVDSLPEALAALAEMTDGRDARQVEWPTAQRRVDGRDPSVAAVVLIRQRQARPEPPQS
jgi:hypothetical protein